MAYAAAAATVMAAVVLKSFSSISSMKSSVNPLCALQQRDMAWRSAGAFIHDSHQRNTAHHNIIIISNNRPEGDGDNCDDDDGR